MKVLLDACIWGGARTVLEAADHDTIWAGEWPEDPGDDEILAFAKSEGRVLITLDKDFGELVVVHGRSHGGIVRLVDTPARRQGPVALDILARYEAHLKAGALITVQPGRIRIRPPGSSSPEGSAEV